MKIFRKYVLDIILWSLIVSTLAYAARFKFDGAKSDFNVHGSPVVSDFVIGVGADSNGANVSVGFHDRTGNIAPGEIVDFWLSDAVSCLGLTTHAPSGTVTALASKGTVLGQSSKTYMRLQTNNTGVAGVEVVDSNKVAFVPCYYSPLSGTVAAPRAFTTADYK